MLWPQSLLVIIGLETSLQNLIIDFVLDFERVLALLVLVVDGVAGTTFFNIGRQFEDRVEPVFRIIQLLGLGELIVDWGVLVCILVDCQEMGAFPADHPEDFADVL